MKRQSTCLPIFKALSLFCRFRPEKSFVLAIWGQRLSTPVIDHSIRGHSLVSIPDEVSILIAAMLWLQAYQNPPARADNNPYSIVRSAKNITIIFSITKQAVRADLFGLMLHIIFCNSSDQCMTGNRCTVAVPSPPKPA